MKKVILAATVLAASASASFAGTYDVEPTIEAPVIVEEATSSSSTGVTTALIILGVIAVAAAAAD